MSGPTHEDFGIRLLRLICNGYEPRPGSGLPPAYEVIDPDARKVVAAATTSRQAAYAAIRLLSGWCE